MKGIAIKKTESKAKKNFPVVAVGASAGGLEAFNELLKHLPADTGMAFVYIQHLDPTHESMLTSIIERVTAMPVQEASEGLKIKPNSIYIIPPNREMSLQNDVLKLSIRPSRPQNHLPINEFFLSLAEHYKEKGIGILLSGNPPDGTIGLKAIKAAGGISFAQDNSAKFAGMPKSAISDDAVDMVLSPRRMAEELVKLSTEHERYQIALQELTEATITDRDENLLNILRQIYHLTGVDFSHYKINTIKRRIVRRMILSKIDTLEDYVQHLRVHSNEVNQLYQDLLINVTSFFRDEETSEYLKKTLLPKIIQEKSASEPLRIWVPACSTGQEAYSLAILILEVLGEKAATTSVQIFATDLSELAVNKARLGIYSKDELAEVSAARLNRFFIRIDGSYRIIKSIRDLCIFAKHNILKDPPFSRLDIISCCNLLIYFEPILQKKVMNTFHYSLNNTGYLLLARSETIGASGYLFSQIDKKQKIYAKKKDAAAKALFELTYRNLDEQQPAEASRHRNVFIKSKVEDNDLDKTVDELLLKKFTPACVVVNGDLDIVQFRGSTGLFLEPSPGKASLNLLKMARPTLGLELRNIVFKASKSGQQEGKSWIQSINDDESRRVTIEAMPIKNDKDLVEKYFLVIFNEELMPLPDSLKGISKDKRVKQLEAELAQLRQDMASIVEEQEAANEELQSVNEEIISSNEELQSINEELETSKEELESSNEELITINQELQMRNEQLAEIQEYSEAIFTTIRECLLILDKQLRIKNANWCFYKTFGVTQEETEGKLLYDVGDKQWNIPRLKELLEEIIPRNSQVMGFEVEHTFPEIGEKIMVLNARRLVRKLHAEQLILLAIEDVTEYRQTQRLIEESEAWFRNVANNSPVMIWVCGKDRKLSFVNDTWLDYRNKTLEEAIGESWMEDMHPDDKQKSKQVMDEAFDKKKEFTIEYHVKHVDGYKSVLSKGKPNYSHKNEFTGFIGSCMELPG